MIDPCIRGTVAIIVTVPFMYFLFPDAPRWALALSGIVAYWGCANLRKES